MPKCPKRFGLFTSHTWGAEKWWGVPSAFFPNINHYIAERKCLVCGEVQQYYQGGASAGWEKVSSSSDRKLKKDRVSLLQMINLKYEPI